MAEEDKTEAFLFSFQYGRSPRPSSPVRRGNAGSWLLRVCVGLSLLLLFSSTCQHQNSGLDAAVLLARSPVLHLSPFSQTIPACPRSHCYRRMPPAGRHVNNRHLFLTVPEAGKAKITVRAASMSGASLLPGSQTAICSSRLCMVEGTRQVSGVSFTRARMPL